MKLYRDISLFEGRSPLSQSRKSNMNVLLNIAQDVVKTLQIAMVFLDLNLGNGRITSDPVKV